MTKNSASDLFFISSTLGLGGSIRTTLCAKVTEISITLSTQRESPGEINAGMTFLHSDQGDQIGQNFAIWVIF